MIEGKIANQCPRNKGIFNNAQCSKCNKELPSPQFFRANIRLFVDKVSSFYFYSYIGNKYFIYESKSGTASIYCSEYCRNKHNHRFQK